MKHQRTLLGQTANGDAVPANADGSETVEGEGTAAETLAQEPVKQEPVKQEPVKEEPVVEDSGHGGHSGQFTVEEMWNQSSGPVRAVLGTLLFMMVAAMGVGLERLITLSSARSQSRKLASEVGSLLKEW